MKITVQIRQWCCITIFMCTPHLHKLHIKDINFPLLTVYVQTGSSHISWMRPTVSALLVRPRVYVVAAYCNKWQQSRKRTKNETLTIVCHKQEFGIPKKETRISLLIAGYEIKEEKIRWNPNQSHKTKAQRKTRDTPKSFIHFINSLWNLLGVNKYY